VDGAGNLYISDMLNQRIRKVTAATGIITTVAGTGNNAGTNIGGFSGDGGPATSADMNWPQYVELDAAGNLYISDFANDVIRKVDAATGIISTIVGVDPGAGIALGFTGDGGAATDAEINGPAAIAFDSLGNLYFADSYNNRVREVSLNTPPLSFSPPTINVGSNSATQTFTVADIGNEPLDLIGIVPSANFATDGTVTTCSTASQLAFGSSCVVGALFSPGTGGTLTGTLTLTDNAMNVSEATQQVGLSGTGLQTTVQVTVNATPSGVAVSVDGVAYSGPQTFTWTIGSNHTLATTSPQTSAGIQNTFVSWSDGGAPSHSVTAAAGTTSYTASFNTGYLLTTVASPTTDGTVSPISGTYYSSGTVVPLTATANSGFTFSNWTGSVADASNASTSVTMNAPQTVTANFNQATMQVTVGTSPSGVAFSVDGVAFSSPQILTWIIGSNHTLATTSPQTSAGIQNAFVFWSDGGALSHSVTAAVGTTSYTAAFNTAYLLTTVANPTVDGIVSPASGTYYTSGTVVPLTATANSGYTFSSWTGSVANPNSASTSIVMNAPQTVTASFTQAATVKVTVGTNPSGASFSVDGVTYTSAQTLTWTIGTSHTLATTSPQNSAGVQNTFISWSDGGALSHSVTAAAGSTSYTASFNTAYLLTTAANPAADGSVSPTSGAYYASGTVVPLTATANSGYSFSNWTGGVANAGNASTSITMNAPQTVTANFTQVATVKVTVGTVPSGVSFSVDGVAYSSAQTLTWMIGSNHTLATTSPQNSAGVQNTFAGWSDGAGISHSVTASAGTISYTATFNTAYLLTTAASPVGDGTVSPAPGTFYSSGTVVPIKATASSGYSFSNWTGSVANAGSASTSVTMNAPQTVTAEFTASSAHSTSTTLKSSRNPACIGDSVTFTATVTSSAGSPTGSVTFYEGTKVLGNTTLVSGKATVTTTFKSRGVFSITAVYAGNSSYLSSTSAALDQEVDEGR
jgi:hypothetical protein